MSGDPISISDDVTPALAAFMRVEQGKATQIGDYLEKYCTLDKAFGLMLQMVKPAYVEVRQQGFDAAKTAAKLFESLAEKVELVGATYRELEQKNQEEIAKLQEENDRLRQQLEQQQGQGPTDTGSPKTVDTGTPSGPGISTGSGGTGGSGVPSGAGTGGITIDIDNSNENTNTQNVGALPGTDPSSPDGTLPDTLLPDGTTPAAPSPHGFDWDPTTPRGFDSNGDWQGPGGYGPDGNWYGTGGFGPDGQWHGPGAMGQDGVWYGPGGFDDGGSWHGPGGFGPDGTWYGPEGIGPDGQWHDSGGLTLVEQPSIQPGPGQFEPMPARPMDAASDPSLTGSNFQQWSDSDPLGRTSAELETAWSQRDPIALPTDSITPVTPADAAIASFSFDNATAAQPLAASAVDDRSIW